MFDLNLGDRCESPAKYVMAAGVGAAAAYTGLDHYFPLPDYVHHFIIGIGYTAMCNSMQIFTSVQDMGMTAAASFAGAYALRRLR